MALCANGVTWEKVQRGDDRLLAAEGRFRVLTDQNTSGVVVGREQRVNSACGISWAIQCNHLDALALSLLDRGDDGFRITGCDQNGLRTGCDHVLHSGDLACVVTVHLASA